MKIEKLLEEAELDGIVGLDYETFWSKDFTLKKCSTTEYVTDPQFKTHMCSIQWHDEKKAVVISGEEFGDWAKQVNWKRTGLLAHHCMPGDVEVLTPRGWVALAKATERMTVMQWHPATGKLSWAQDAQKITSRASSLYEWNTSFHKCAYTPEHRMYLHTPESPTWRVETAAQVAARSPNNTYIPLSGVYEAAEQIQLSEDEAALMEAIRADGAWQLHGNKCYGARFKLKKLRKIQRLRGLLHTLNLETHSTERIYDAGVTVISIRTCPLVTRIFALLGAEKEYGFWVLNLSIEARVEILRSARFWDGSTKPNGRGYAWACADAGTVEAFQLLAHTSGWSISGKWRNNERGYTANKKGARLYTATVRKNSRAKLVSPAVKKRYGGKVYCFSVPHEALLVRSKDRVFVTGNCQFDGLIASHHYKVVPAFYFDTISMARPIMPVTVRMNLDSLARALGFAGKRGAGSLIKTQGLRDLPDDLYAKLARYAGNDIQQTWMIFKKLLEFHPFREFVVMDATLRMYCQPRFLFDKPALEAFYNSEVAAKAEVCERLKVTPQELRSTPKFLAQLKALKVEPPRKPDGKVSLAKTNLAFKALLGHKNERVRELVKGRLRLSSSIDEKRAQLFMNRADLGPQPVYLNYAKALTWRWTGGDKSNFQNLTRGSPMRRAIKAPKGHTFVFGDASQIEARMNAEFSGQRDVVELFRSGKDVYAVQASSIYSMPITKETHPHQRQLGKVAVLSLGYQAGAVRFTHTVRTDKQMPLDITDEMGAETVRGWRQNNPFICSNWKASQSYATQAFLGKMVVDHGCVAYEGRGRHGYMHLPGGRAIRYYDLQLDENGALTYLRSPPTAKKPEGKRVKIYGGLLCIAEGTQVLTRLEGWKPIEQITLRDQVHDGESWCSHQGLVYKGINNCASVDGVRMTPDHEVLTDEGWLPALAQPRPHRPALRHSDCPAPRGFRWKKDALGVPLRLWERSGESRGRSDEGTQARVDAESHRVYDILNCGPKQRFVVAGETGPVIVHNCENRTQALSCIQIADVIVEMRKRAPWAQLVLTVHDEVVYCVPNRFAERTARILQEAMTTPPSWMPNLPLAADLKIAEVYGK